MTAAAEELGGGSGGAAELQRIREVEERLLEAIEGLQRRRRLARCGNPPCDHTDESCAAHAVGSLCQSFVLSYGVRVGTVILLRAFRLARRRSSTCV